LSFGGGGGGSTTVTAHKHTNALGDGSNLDDTTLQPSGTITLSNTIFLKAVMFG